MSDRYEALNDNWHELSRQLNVGNGCLDHCPGVAAAVHQYLSTGTMAGARCGGAGYAFEIEAHFGHHLTFAAILQRVRRGRHGFHVVVQAHRPPNTGFTDWHYFNLLNIHGTVYLFDAFTFVRTSDRQEMTRYLSYNHLNRFWLSTQFSARMVSLADTGT